MITACVASSMRVDRTMSASTGSPRSTRARTGLRRLSSRTVRAWRARAVSSSEFARPASQPRRRLAPRGLQASKAGTLSPSIGKRLSGSRTTSLLNQAGANGVGREGRPDDVQLAKAGSRCGVGGPGSIAAVWATHSSFPYDAPALPSRLRDGRIDRARPGDAERG